MIGLLLETLHLLWCARVRRWWRRPPYLPRVSVEWIKFRLDTAYGLRQHELGSDAFRKSVREEALPRRFWRDVVQYLKWRRHMRSRRSR